MYFNTNWSIYLINRCLTHSRFLSCLDCAHRFLSCVHIRKGLDHITYPEHFEHLSLDWENVSETFQCDNQGRRMDERHHRQTNWTRVFCTPASPHVNELKSEIKDENARKIPDIRVFFKVYLKLKWPGCI